MTFHDPAMQEIHEELQRTALLSERFKDWIYVRLMAGVEQAYDRGFTKGTQAKRENDR